jgi:hypothetical protein
LNQIFFVFVRAAPDQSATDAGQVIYVIKSRRIAAGKDKDD